MDKKEKLIILDNIINNSIENNNFSQLDDFKLNELIIYFNSINYIKLKNIYIKLPLSYQLKILEHSSFHLENQLIDIITSSYSDKKIYNLIKTLDTDDIVDILLEIDIENRENILSYFQEKEKKNLYNLLTYPEDTAGGIMTKEYFSVSDNMKVKDVRKKLKQTEDIHSLLYAYVVNKNKNLIGVLSLHDLSLANADDKIEDIMTKDVIKVTAYTDQEKIANMIEKYDFFAIPVVTDRNKLIGIITSDDVIDVIREEETEDIYKGIGVDEEEIYKKNILAVAKMRLPWLITTFFGSMLSASLLSVFSNTLHEVIILTSFIPVITAMGGNIGTQTATIVVRGMAIGYININKLKKTLLREIGIAFIMSIIVALIISSITIVWHGKYMLGIILGISMILGIVTASFIGTLIPFLFHKINIDPAIATGPFVTTTNDATGIIIYLGLSTIFLNYLT